MSAGKGDKWRRTDFKRYFNSPLWDSLKNKKTLDNKNKAIKMSVDARNDQDT